MRPSSYQDEFVKALEEFTVTILWLMWRCFRQDTSSQPCVYTFQHLLMTQTSLHPIGSRLHVPSTLHQNLLELSCDLLIPFAVEMPSQH